MEQIVKREILQANKDLRDGHVQSMLRRWFVETEGTVKVCEEFLQMSEPTKCKIILFLCAVGAWMTIKSLMYPSSLSKVLNCVRSLSQAYLWDNNQAVVEWLEKHLSKEEGCQSAIRENIKYLKRENALKHIRR